LQPLATLGRVAGECWYRNASARLTALRVKKTISSVLDDLTEL